MRIPFWGRWRIERFRGPGFSIRVLFGFFMISFEWDSESIECPGQIRRILFLGFIPWNVQAGQVVKGWSVFKRTYYRQQEAA